MKPDILLIQTDQLFSRVLNAYGGVSATPVIDELCSSGAIFENCFCQFPLCQPSRGSLWSGMYPHKTDILSNGRNWPVRNFGTEYKTLGEVFSEAGYKTIHFGKCHDGGTLRGFECIKEEETVIKNEHPAWPYNMDTYEDRNTCEKACRFLEEWDYSSPLLMAVDFVNPHNICGWVGTNKGIHTDIPLPPELPGSGLSVSLPPLPPNFDFDDIENRAASIRYICCSHVRQSQAAGWTPDNFRHYLAAYHYYLNVVDREIERLLAVLNKRGKTDNTIIFFFSDHGDNVAARNCVTKQVNMYEECIQVPLAVCGPGILKRKEKISGLACLLDIAPTLCECASIPCPDNFDGISLYSSIYEGKKVEREYAACQWHTEWGYTVSPSRMIRTERYKYIHYLEDDFEELYDLEQDPYEKKNRAKNPAYDSALNYMRTLFEDYLTVSADPYRTLEWKADKRWRSHPCGYHNHRGSAAPQV
ncbi:sulfatase family protein [Treponema sp.]|uniref:sulfatase family protein n=1 Tax=Treponema sp. TaxID=166 RepID=UPI003FA25D94